MIAMPVRSLLDLPPKRELVELEPESETLGEQLERLRKERKWTQYDVAARVDPERADDPRAMKNLQTLLSRYELDTAKRHDPVLLEKLEEIYGLDAESLSVVAMRTLRQIQKRAKIREHGIAIWPVEPEFVEAVRALFLVEPEELTDAAEQIRIFAKAGREPLLPKTEDEEAAS